MIGAPLDLSSQAPLGAPALTTTASSSPRPPAALGDVVEAIYAGLEELRRAELTAPPRVALSAAQHSTGASSFLAGLDPSLMIAVLQAELRDSSAQVGESSVADAAHHAETAHTQEREALERAEKAGRRAQRLMKRAPKWVKKLVSSIISAIGVLASAYTGGASLGLAIAGATLLLMADTLVPTLERIGAIDAEQAAWLTVALQVAGTVLSCCSGGGAANAAGQTAEAAGKVARVVQGTLEAVDAGLDVGLAVVQGQQDDAMLDADEAMIDIEQASAALEEEIDRLEDSMKFFHRVAARMSALAEVEDHARLSSVRQLA